MIKLPDKLQEEQDQIKNEWDKVENTWKDYTNELIPQDIIFAKKIIQFSINVLNHIIDNYDDNKEEMKQLQEFIAYYPINFFYGPMGDDYNYLDFDEGSLYWILFKLRPDELVPKSSFEEAKDAAKNLLKEFD
ncbi:hypothetical protein HOK51_11020 [Candidatus Woesearchaeota archaeon]|jgi:hypothetical protein|nr:hypothetical protein [Candidatus Woesearchaeota archaeon]MBT6520353.1 hypothetical protein [Candidatus Woesearchaeota archaeon]MBT7368565.1 hypothetical protein [Candidatus Woesearchaeota archaeon]